MKIDIHNIPTDLPKRMSSLTANRRKNLDLNKYYRSHKSFKIRHYQITSCVGKSREYLYRRLVKAGFKGCYHESIMKSIDRIIDKTIIIKNIEYIVDSWSFEIRKKEDVLKIVGYCFYYFDINDILRQHYIPKPKPVKIDKKLIQEYKIYKQAVLDFNSHIRKWGNIPKKYLGYKYVSSSKAVRKKKKYTRHYKNGGMHLFSYVSEIHHITRKESVYHRISWSEYYKNNKKELDQYKKIIIDYTNKPIDENIILFSGYLSIIDMKEQSGYL